MDQADAIVDGNLYLTLGTADEAGVPWAAPVYYVASPDRRTFYWVSKPGARHSRNLDVRPELSLVIFDSASPVGQGRAVYVAAAGALVPEDELDAGLAVYNGPAAARGATPFSRTDVTAPARHRLYRAVARHAWILDDRDERVPLY